jgi:FkbM family methyltransferase
MDVVSESLRSVRVFLMKAAGVATLEQHSYLPQLMVASSRVVDAGANQGRFAVGMINRHGCRVLAVEPEESNFLSLPHHPLLRRVRAALAAKCGDVIMSISDESTAHRVVNQNGPESETSTERVVSVTLTELMRQENWDYLDLLKLDIEGMEWDVLNSVPDEILVKFLQITIEFHDFAGLAPDSNATWRAYQRFHRLGFWEIEDPVGGPYNTLFVSRSADVPMRTSVAFSIFHALAWLARKWNRLHGLVKMPMTQ